MSLRLQQVDLGKLGWDKTTEESTNADAGDNDLLGALYTPLESLTEETLEGKGAFDVLMRSTKLHLKEEFDAGRITGKEYSTVYLGALSTVLQTATQFLLNEQQVHKLNADIGLVRQQTVTELAETDDSVPEGLGFNHKSGVITPIPSIVSPAPKAIPITTLPVVAAPPVI